IHTQVAEWRGKSFVQRYRVVRANPEGSEDLIMECDEVRIFAARREGTATGIRAVPIPDSIRQACL
ncbi:MAG: acyl-CoA thioesterase, partial [Burkholderiaceae bacterium]|nr:acyl-CoA thioesterase [Burkholderiaceae bacterium]